MELEYQRNEERYKFLRWGQTAFSEFKVVPPGTGIVHQVNIEHLARVVMTRNGQAYPDTLVGTDSHTTMVNGLGVLGWGVGGIEAEAAMLGQPVSMLIPKVVGFQLSGELPPGATATDLVLTITEMLREHGVVGKFVEFYGEGVGAVPLANRATIGNMSPEFGSTCAIFPIDDETLNYLRFTGRDDDAGRPRRGLLQGAGPLARPVARARTTPRRSRSTSRRSCRRSPARSARRTASRSTPPRSRSAPRCPDYVDDDGQAHSQSEESDSESFPASDPPAEHPNGDADRPAVHRQPVDPGGRASHPVPVTLSDGTQLELDHGAVTIAAITSCTNTSNPSVMIGAALLARNAVEKGLERRPWVKTSLAPGSKVVMDYYERSGPAALPGEARASTSSATAAPPASATPGRCPRRSRRRSTTATSRSPRCSRATATSRAASTPT